jgi:hypothetical protein
MADRKISELEHRGIGVSKDDLLLVVTPGDQPTNQSLKIQDLFNHVRTFVALDDGIDIVSTENLSCSVMNNITHIEGSFEGPLSVTLGVGIQGQIKILIMTVQEGHAVTLTGAFVGFSEATFNNVGDTLTLIHSNGAWVILSSHNTVLL